MNPQVKNYRTYHSMLLEFSQLSSDIDLDATIRTAPQFSFKRKSGEVVLASNLTHMLENVRDEFGILVNPFASQQVFGSFVVSYEDFAPAQQKELAPVEIKDIDTPAKKRSTRKITKE